jgi:ATP-dependent DNA helicase RecQ
VITPLIALMKDQVDQLSRRRIKATAIHSGMTRYEIDVTLNNCVYGDYKFLYLSPERLSTELFLTRVRDMNVNLIAVDEAHCISQWGYDFRPSYLEISSLRKELEGVPVLALTATATPEVSEDIQERLLFREKRLLKKSFHRENLTYMVRQTENKPGELTRMVLKLKGSGIIYTRNRKKCREIALMLQEEGVTAEFYHAGLKQEKRNQRHQGWTENRYRVIVATNAFGMGIDKPDVRFVIHVDLPDSPESYFQEAGRAGRDGQKSWAVLLYSPADERLLKQRIEVNFPGIPKVREVYMALCNYLQIAQGSGKGHQYNFEIGEFLHRFKFNAMVANSAITILCREGYLSLTDAFHNPSRIKFQVERDALYQFQVNHGELDGFIKLLLRSYSGLFTQFVKIDEVFLARRSGLSAERVYHYLITLSTRQIISYIPRKEVPVITFLEERLDEKNLFISSRKYNFRKERYENRVMEMLRYASALTLCRTQFLLSYFGQLDTPACGRCDVCLSKDIPDSRSEEFQSMARSIEAILLEEPMSLEKILSSLKSDPEDVARVAEWLVDRGKVVRDKNLLMRWKKGSPEI